MAHDAQRVTIRRGPRLLAAGLLVALLAAACGTSDGAAGPPDINYGRDVCVGCSMVISEARFAAAYRLGDGTEKKFDDLGGLLIHGHETDELAAATVWVHDYQTEEWVDAPLAHYVPTRSEYTPMGYGIFAFSEMGRASEFAAGVDGEVIGWDIVLQLPTSPGQIEHSHDDETNQSDTMDGMDHG